ncbi:MAG: CHAT domain-containing protein, partial [Spirulina sp.]
MSKNSVVKKVLLLTSSPVDWAALRLGEEEREIDEVLRHSQLRNLFELKSYHAVRTRDLHSSMLNVKPNIVHFCGHGTGEEGLVFEDNTGRAKLVSTEALATLFKLFDQTVECVVLNACYAEVQAQAISQHIRYVVGMRQAIGDRAAIEFARGFYQALGAGESIERAFEFGCSAIQIEGLPEHLTPVLKTKPDVVIRKDNSQTMIDSLDYNHVGEEICIDRRRECITFDRMRSRDRTIRQHILAFQVPSGKGKSLLLRRFYYICKVDVSEGKPILYAKVDFRDRPLMADSLVGEILGTFIINAEEVIQKLSSSAKFSAAHVTQLKEAYEKIISQLNQLYEEVENLTKEQTQSAMSQLQQLKLARVFSAFCRSISEQWTVVLLLDTWEDAGMAGDWFLKHFIPQIVDLQNVIAVLAGREGLISLESRPDEVIFRTNFTPVKADDCQRWAELKYNLKINEATAEQLIRRTQGDSQQIDMMLKTLKDFPDD